MTYTIGYQIARTAVEDALRNARPKDDSIIRWLAFLFYAHASAEALGGHRAVECDHVLLAIEEQAPYLDVPPAAIRRYRAVASEA